MFQSIFALMPYPIASILLSSHRITIPIALFISLVFSLSAQTEPQIPHGTLKGTVINKATQEVVVGAMIRLKSELQSQSTTQKPLGAVANSQGEFSIKNIPVGSYTLHCKSIGYAAQMIADVVIRSGRITEILIEMEESASAADTVVVQGSYFATESTNPASSVSFSAEEIRRAPGSGGDLNRALNVLPSISRSSDQYSDLIVRGGSPMENGFYIDNIPFTNINYFPRQGSSGGILSFINIDLIRNVNFLTGGFTASFGDRMSSVLDIALREGNKERFEGQFDFNMTGVGGIVEGPLPLKGSSWVVSLNRSYLDMIAGFIDDNNTVPGFNHAQGKIVLPLGESHTISLLGTSALSEISNTAEEAKKNGENLFREEYWQHVYGANWRWLWGSNGYSQTSLSYSSTSTEDTDHSPYDNVLYYRNNYTESALHLRNLNYYTLSPYVNTEFGIEARRGRDVFDVYIDRNIDTLSYRREYFTTKLSAFASLTAKPFEGTGITMGARADYNSLSTQMDISPRLALRQRITDNLAVNAAYGWYSQSLPAFLLSQHSENTHLPTPRANHYIAGIEYLPREDVKITLEAYHKGYKNMPANPAAPYSFLIDDNSGEDSFRQYGILNSVATAQSQGIELLIQKKLNDNFYGMTGLSLMRSSYTSADGIERNRKYDNGIIFNIVGGWVPNSDWELSARFTYVGGNAYTPFNIDSSRRMGYGILELSRYNAEHLPAYHTLNIRVDRRFHFSSSSLILYISVLNAYNRKNLYGYSWNNASNSIKEHEQLGIIPVLGVEWEL